MSLLKQCYKKDLKMEEFESSFEVPLIAMYFLTASLIIIFNLLVFLTTVKTPSLHSPSRILLASLTLNDLFIGLLAQPLYITYCIAALKRSFPVFCYTYLVNLRLTYSLGTISLFTLTAISIDRYIAVTTKTAYRTIVTAKRVKRIVFSVWFLIITFFCAILQFWNFTGMLHIGVVMAIIILTILTFCYSASYLTLKKLSSRVSSGSTENQQSMDFNVTKYRRSLNNMLIILMTTLMSYVPLVGVAVINLLVDLEYKIFVVHGAQFLTGFNSVVNPLFYVWRMNDIRSALWNLIVKFKSNVLCA